VVILEVVVVEAEGGGRGGGQQLRSNPATLTWQVGKNMIVDMSEEWCQRWSNRCKNL
jgi:hypothetical protein